MKFLDELASEHELIEQVAGSLLTYASRFAAGDAPATDGVALVRFFRLFAGKLHHGKEEDVLFPALVREARLPGDRGPIQALLADHEEMAELLKGMEEILASGITPESSGMFLAISRSYANQLLHHIDAENSVLIPEAEARLARAGVRELETREPTSQELEAGLSGRVMVERYPPTEDPEVVRGEGCVMCASYGVRCEGLEREWWNEYEWLESDEHIASS